MKGPFDLSMVTPEYPLYSHLLAIAIGQLKELPDFSDDDRVAVMSDFSGDHKGAWFNTYTFIIFAHTKIALFASKVEKLRRKYGIFEPYSEFAFKDLKFGPRSRALAEFLALVDNFIHGAIITIAIEKRIGTVFGATKQEAHKAIVSSLESANLGKWNGETGEKVLRVCHAIALFTGLTTTSGQKLLWYCDKDSINDDGIERNFAHTQKIFAGALGMYSKHKYSLLGFGKSFDNKSYLDDLLSISDFAAGTVQDILQAHKSGNDSIHGEEEKELLLKWMTNQGKFLSKITIEISELPNGDIGCGVVEFLPAKQVDNDKE